MKRIKSITPPDSNAMNLSRQKWNSVAKPLHSLGLLEETVIKIAGITGNPDFTLNKRCVVDMCADNGVVCEGVTQTDSSVTSIVAKAMANGTSNINRMAQTFGADVIPVDIGMKNDVDDPNLINRKIAYGTENLAVGPAMTIEQVEKAISVGIDMVAECAEKGYNIIVTGEMGIGNTTTSSAIASVLLDIPPEFVTGRGAGLDKEGFARKLTVIHDAVRMHRPYSTNPVEIMSKLGGYDIAGMTGLFLGGAIYHIPIVIDGFISAVSGALAVGINPIAKEYMLCSHVSKEPAGKLILQHIGLKPLITAEMCLGEGTGGIMLLPMLDGTLAVYNSSHRFDELPMERYVEL